MVFNPNMHHRRSLRLQGYDYSQAGAYFVTICTHNRACLFGEVVDGEMRLNETGRMVASALQAISDHFPQVDVDAFVVMPNHVHGIIVINGVGAQFIAPNTHETDAGAMNRAPTGWLVGFDPNYHHRHSLRLQNYDYAQAGAYFVTICTQNRACLFGEVVDGKMQLNAAGQMVLNVWNEISTHYLGVEVDAFVVMPNHVHGVVVITNPVGAQFIAPNTQGAINQGAINRAPTLGEIVRAFKARSTRNIRLREPGASVWQRNYYEHIIRSEESLTRVREYIINNPLQWVLDRENPANTKQG